jgi:hypothetical protein
MAETACRAQSRNEEIANSLSHGLGALLAAVFSPQLIANALQAGTLARHRGRVYCASMILLFSVSAAYHWLPPAPPRTCCAGWTTRPSSCSSPARTRRFVLGAWPRKATGSWRRCG